MLTDQLFTVFFQQSKSLALFYKKSTNIVSHYWYWSHAYRTLLYVGEVGMERTDKMGDIGDLFKKFIENKSVLIFTFWMFTIGFLFL